MDTTLVGRTAEPFEMPIELGKIREFAKATKSSRPEYDGEEAIAPATFLMTAAFWSGPDNTAWPAGSIDLARLLHGEQEFVFHGPPPAAGTRLRAQARIDRVFEKEGRRGGSMTFGESVIEFFDASTGELVAESRSTAIETAKPAGA
jgi:hypothetical protein